MSREETRLRNEVEFWQERHSRMLEVVDRLEAEFEDERKAHARTREYMRACAQTLFRERRDGPVPGSAAEGGRMNDQERLKRENERLLKLLRNEREGIAALIERHEALEKENERLRNENETLEELLADLKDVRF